VYKELFTAKKYLELRKVVLVQMFLAWTLPFYTVGVVMYISRMGLPSFQMGITLSIVVIGSVLGHNLSSLLITRFRCEPKRVLVFCMPILLVCNIQFFWAHESYLLLTGLYFGHGTLVGVNFTSVNVIYRRLLPDEENERESISAKFNPLVNIAAGISGLAVTSFIGKSAWNLSDVLFSIVATIVLFRIRVPEYTETANTTKETSPLSLKWKLVVIGLPILIVSGALRSIEAYFPVLLGTQSGILITVYFVVNGFTADLVTRVVKKSSRRRKVINGCLILMGASSGKNTQNKNHSLWYN
jgi:MFS family permease